MAIYDKQGLCRAFENAVLFDDDDIIQAALTKLQVHYELLSEDELYRDLIASLDILHPEPGRDTDRQIAKACKSDEIPDKHADLLGMMLEILSYTEYSDPVMERCKKLIGFYDEHNPNNIQEGLFGVMASHIAGLSQELPKPKPRALN